VYQIAGHIYRLGNKFDKARAQFDVAQQMVERFKANDPKNPAYREMASDLLREKSVLAWMMGRPAEAEPLARSALEAALSLRTEFPTDPQYKRTEARLRSLVGTLAREFGRFDDALSEFDKSIALWKPLADGQEVSPTDGVELIIALDGRGTALFEKGQNKPAAEVLGKAIHLSQALLVREPDDPDRRYVLAGVLHNWGRVLAMDPDRRAEAGKAFDEAVDLCRGLVRDFPDIMQNRAYLAEKLEARATLETKESRDVTAQKDFQEATLILDTLLKRFPDSSEYNELLARTLVDQAILARIAGRTAELGPLLKRAKECLDRALNVNPEGFLNKRTLANYQSERARIADGGDSQPPKP
jgi:tetratricopeptide (TPR) repeat protein